MGDVVKFPAPRPGFKVPKRKYYRWARKRDELVWHVCEYLKNLGECDRCPRHENHPEYGKGTRGCRMMAEEVIALSISEFKR